MQKRDGLQMDSCFQGLIKQEEKKMAFPGLSPILSRWRNDIRTKKHQRRGCSIIIYSIIIIIIYIILRYSINKTVNIHFDEVCELHTYDKHQIPWDVWYVIDKGYYEYTNNYCDLSGIEFDFDSYTYFISSRYKIEKMVFCLDFDVIVDYYIFNIPILPTTYLRDTGNNELVYVYKAKRKGVLQFNDGSEDETKGFGFYNILNGSPIVDYPSIWINDEGKPNGPG